jgi:general secretion pathway protein G
MVRRLGLILPTRLKRRGQLVRTARAAGRPENVSGFTLVELMIVMLIIGVLMAIAVPNYLSSLKGAKEAVLKEDLHVLRQAIDAYTVDKEKAPQSLDDLVQAGYLKALPVDPMTRSNTTWVADTSDSLHSLDQTEPGIDDVHSGSQEASSNGELYNTW